MILFSLCLLKLTCHYWHTREDDLILELNIEIPCAFHQFHRKTWELHTHQFFSPQKAGGSEKCCTVTYGRRDVRQ